MTVIDRIQTKLKPKVKQFGFTKKVFRSVAAKIADKLGDIEEDASEDDINAKIDDAIEVSMPYLALIQSMANEQLDEWKKEQQKKNDDDNEDEDPSDDDLSDDEDGTNQSRRKRSVRQARRPKNDVEPAWFKKYREEQEAKFEALKGEKIADTRRSKMEELLKDSGSFGKAAMRIFAKANFESDDDFDEYYSGVAEDLKAYNQERADAGLSAMGNPPGTKGGKRNETTEVLTEDEIKAIAQM